MEADVGPLLCAATVRERLAARFGDRATFRCGPRATDVTVCLAAAADLPDVAGDLVAGLGLGLATLVATDERNGPAGAFVVRYLFEPARPAPGALADLFVCLEVVAGVDHPSVPSLTPTLPAADWHEREMRDLLGIEPEGHPDPRSLVVHDGWPAGHYPLRKDFDPAAPVPRLAAEEFPHLEVEGEGVVEIPVGPIHAGIIEPGHFRFSAIGETVLHLDARLFYTHRGLEKRAEGLAPADAFFIAERLCGACSAAHGLAFAEALEQLAGVAVSARARYLRSVVLELERLYNHVGDIGNMCAGIAYHWGASSGARMKETVQRVNERLTGNRFLRGFIVPGGVHHDLAGDADEIREAVRVVGAQLAALMGNLERNSSVVDRLDGTGALTAQAVRDLGATGVAARASGVDRDARRDHPHAAYGLPGAPRPVVATKSAGDSHSRLKVRALEAEDSIRLLLELLAGVPEGQLCAPLPDVLPAWQIGLGVVESPRGASITWLRTDANGRVDRYHVRSASYANWPVVPIAALGAIVPDFPLVNKSFELCYACTDR